MRGGLLGGRGCSGINFCIKRFERRTIKFASVRERLSTRRNELAALRMEI